MILDKGDGVDVNCRGMAEQIVTGFPSREEMNSSNRFASIKRRQADYETLLFTAAIASFTFAAESIARGNLISASAILPLITAVQLLAGVWLGPFRGTAAATVGGFLGYELGSAGGSFTQACLDPIVAGGVVNSLLPSLLLLLLRISVRRESDTSSVGKNFLAVSGFLACIILAASGSGSIPGTKWLEHIPVLFVCTAGVLLFLHMVKGKQKKFLLLEVVLLSCLESALMGAAVAAAQHQGWAGSSISAGISWFAWDLSYSLLGLCILNSFGVGANRLTDGAAKNTSKAYSTVIAGFFSILLILSVAGSVLQFTSVKTVQMEIDSYDYVEIAAHGPFSEKFWTATYLESPVPEKRPQYIHRLFGKIGTADLPPLQVLLSRPPLYPMVIWLLRGNLLAVAWAQFVVSLCCWLLLAIAVFKLSENSTAGLIGTIPIILLGMLPNVAVMCRVIMTESLSLSLLAGAFGLTLLFLNKFELRWAILAALFLSLFALIRDGNAYLVLCVAVTAAIVTLWQMRRGKIGRQRAFFYLAVSAVMAASFLAASVSATEGERWVFPFYENLTYRVLEDSSGVNWYGREGMPISETLLHRAHKIDLGFYDDPDLSSFRRWMDLKGEFVYAKWLLEHPEQSVLVPVEHLPDVLSASLRAWAPSSYRPLFSDPSFSRSAWGKSRITGYETLFSEFEPFARWKYVLWAFLLLALIILCLRSKSEKKKRVAALTIITLFLAIPHLLVSWNGAVTDLFRHTSEVELQIQIAVLALGGVSLDTIAAAISRFTAAFISAKTGPFVIGKDNRI